MNLTQKYPIAIEQWVHSPSDKFLGLLSDNGYDYIFGITPEDPKDNEVIYFNIWIEKIIKNETTNGVVFFAKTYSCFKVRNKGEKPTAKFFFILIEIATFDFAQQFHQRTKGTNISHHRIQKARIEDLQEDIEKTIDIWNKSIRDSAKTKPNWQTKFRDLPTIPIHKNWRVDSHTTIEQDIALKLRSQIPISNDEEKIFSELASFYENLDIKLKELDYSSFTQVDFENFKNYIFYAFNYHVVVTNKLTVLKTYRLVVNEYVIKTNEAITDVTFLKYPKIEIVKEIKKFNRANTSNTTVFYASENIDTALKEIRPPKNKLITVGVWIPKDVNKKLISFPILHSEEAMDTSESVKKATMAFEEHGNYNSTLFMNYMRYYFKLFGREFTKKVSHHYEYYISSLFAERVFEQNSLTNKELKFDCIVYPSVGNDFITENLAIHPDTLDNDFNLSEVLEFEVEESYYDKKYTLHHPDIITLAKIKNFRKTNKISERGHIEW